MLHEVSVLIPVFNTDAAPLVLALHKQAQALLLRFEIRVYDDCSTDQTQKVANRTALDGLPHVIYQEREANLGRAAIRNLLATDARYSQLLFIDADSALPDNSFLRAYKQHPKNAPVLAGGTIYALQKPAPDKMLRWTFGHKREARTAALRNRNPYHTFTLNNLLIDRAIFLRIQLDASIKTYGHEDTLFGERLYEEEIPVTHIDNPVIHTGLESSGIFLEKTRQAVRNIWLLNRQHGSGMHSGLISAFLKVKKIGGISTLVNLIQPLENHILRNLLSPKPSLRLFDLYKLYLICKLEMSESGNPGRKDKEDKVK